MSAVLRFDHLALPVYDAAATYRFYSEVLELPLVEALSGENWGGLPWLMMFFATGSGQLLALCARRSAPPPAPEFPEDVRHFAFAVASADELDGWRGRLRRHGIPWSEETHAHQHSLYFKDPNGIMLEVTTPASVAPLEPDAAAAQAVRRWIAAAASAAPRA